MSQRDWIDRTTRRIMIGLAMPDPEAYKRFQRLRKKTGDAPMAVYLANSAVIPEETEAFRRQMETAFDPQLYVRTLKRMGIQVLYHHAKNHLGISCYRTKAGYPHSLMGNRDFFGELVAECREHDIVPGAIFQVGTDELSALEHPEWRQQSPTGDTSVFRLCFNHPEWRKKVFAQTEEIVSTYDIAAFMYDEVSFGWHTFGHSCYCPHCRDRFRVALGYEMPETEDWDSPEWRAFVRWRYESVAEFLQEGHDLIRRLNPGVLHTQVYYGNPGKNWRSWSTEQTAPIFDYLLCDKGGVDEVGLTARYYRSVSRCRPEIAVGSRLAMRSQKHVFAEADLPTPFPAFFADLMTAAANGAVPGFESMGWYNRRFYSVDKGVMCSPAYDALYTRASEEIRRRDPWLGPGEPVRHAALVCSEDSRDFYGRDNPLRYTESYMGWFRSLRDSQTLFDVVPEHTLSAERLREYAVVVLANSACLAPDRAASIREYVAGGGGLVASYASTLCDQDGNVRDDFLLGDVFGVRYDGGLENDLAVADRDCRSHAYHQVFCEKRHALLENVVSPGERMISPAAVLLATARHGAESVGVLERIDPPEKGLASRSGVAVGIGTRERLSHPAFAVRQFGEGTSVYFAARLGGAYAVYGHPFAHRVMVNAVRLVERNRSPVEVRAPKSVEATAFRQTAPDRLVIHLVNFQTAPYRAHVLGLSIPVSEVTDEILPVHDVEISVALPPGTTVRRIYQAPEQKNLGCETADDGRVVFQIPKLEIHTMGVVELGGSP